MGYFKYYEDDQDRILDSISYYGEISNYTTKSVEPPIFNCDYCNMSFYSKEDLYEHIKREHNIISSIVLVNGKIIQSECYVKELKSIKIVRYDLNNLIYINKTHIEEYDSLNEIDITDKIYQNFLTSKSITITVGKKEFKILLVSRGNININKINKIISQWSLETSKKLHISKDYTSFNEIERICLNGLYNYFVACISDGKNKDSRYNDAFAILSEVADILPVATIILKIIAFKFNWVDRLRILCVGNDIFSSIYKFMINTQTKITSVSNPKKWIFIEDNLEEIIQYIIAYQNNEYSIVESFVNRYPIRSIAEINDLNQRDKICLLCARMALKKSNRHEARRYYDEIQAPCFDEEKKNYIKTM
ncbi:MAG: C2H2-type zinc finger protein [Clostridiales bacterium]|nr:C2H2-type zinc finger protein [Clostridiales bacterium]